MALTVLINIEHQRANIGANGGAGTAASTRSSLFGLLRVVGEGL